VTTADNQLLSIERDTGKILWRKGRGKPTGLTILGYGAPARARDRLVAVYSDGYVVAYALVDGEVLWERPLSLSEADFHDANATPVILGDTVFVASYSEGLYALSLATGAVVWNRPLPSVISLATSKQDLFVGSADGFVWGVSPRDGELKFRTRVEGPVIGLQHHEGALVFAGGESGLVVLRGANGAPLQATSLGSRAINAPALVGNHLALVSASGHLYSFELGAPPYNLR
jgi:outer membrane protein assembly factor BamB